MDIESYNVLSTWSLQAAFWTFIDLEMAAIRSSLRKQSWIETKDSKLLLILPETGMKRVEQCKR